MIGWVQRRQERITEQHADAILAALADGAAHYVYGDLDRLTGLHAGSMYPALARLEVAGRIESGWADRGPGQPRRRWYRIADTAAAP